MRLPAACRNWNRHSGIACCIALCLFALCLSILNTSQVGYWNFVTYENDEGPAVPADFEHFKAASSGALGALGALQVLYESCSITIRP